ncbi:hypothetical protein KA005_77030 [bacterium]|nr:hypothetical protein [bacterium]
MNDLLSGIWRNSDHTLLIQIYDGKADPRCTVNGTINGYDLLAMVWVIDEKGKERMLSDLLISTTFISVLPKRQAWIGVKKVVKHGPGIYAITARVTSNERWMA